MNSSNTVSNNSDLNNSIGEDLYTALTNSVYASLETYSNVHRGSGHNSLVTTHLYEKARKIVLDYMGLSSSRYIVIFLTPRTSRIVLERLNPKSYQCLSDKDIGLRFGIKAIAVDKRSLKKLMPPQTGGGTTSLISPNWIIWANAPDRFEAGTPAIINIIAFASALRMERKSGSEIFPKVQKESLSANQIIINDDLDKFTGKELLVRLRQTLIGRKIIVPTVKGDRPFINLDNSASTPAFEPTWESVCRTWHQPVKIQQDIIKKVRSICLEFLGAPSSSYELIFTSNATEAINLVAESYGLELKNDIEQVILSSVLEHSSNDLPWRMIKNSSIVRLSIDNEGFLDLNEIETLLQEYNHNKLHGKKRITLVAISGASNVMGTYNNLEDISHIVHLYGAQLLIDAAQLIAHRKVDMNACGIDYLAFSAHKVYAPFGTGVLAARKGLLNFSQTELDQIQSSGEENVGGIAALGKSLVLLQRIGLEIIREEEKELTRKLLTGLSQIAEIKIYGLKNIESQRFDQKGGVVVFTMKGLMSDKVARELSIRGGIGVRYGCHCAHILVKHILGVSPGLERFQRIIVSLFPVLRLPGVTRVSLGIGNTEEDIDHFINTLASIGSKKQGPESNVNKKIKNFIKEREERVYSKSD